MTRIFTELATAVVAVAIVAACGLDMLGRRVGRAVRHG